MHGHESCSRDRPSRAEAERPCAGEARLLLLIIVIIAEESMDLRARLKSRGHKLTPQRALVFQVLTENAGRPMRPEDIFRCCAEKGGSMSLPTVYRTLQLFTRLGVALPVHLHEDAQYYEINLGKHHHHFVCIGCGTVEPVEACMIDQMKEVVRDNHDFLITSHCLSLFGYCPGCLSEQEN